MIINSFHEVPNSLGQGRAEERPAFCYVDIRDRQKGEGLLRRVSNAAVASFFFRLAGSQRAREEPLVLPSAVLTQQRGRCGGR